MSPPWLAAVAVAAAAGVAVVSAEDTVSPSATSRILFGSCNDPRLPERVWPAIHRRLRPGHNGAQGDTFVWAGDIVYGDDVHLGFKYDKKRPWKPVHVVPANDEELQDLYAQVKRLPGYATLLSRNTTVLGIYDDHDYGHNNGDRTFQGRSMAQSRLLDFLEVPTDSPRRERLGAYHAEVLDFGGPERQVAVVLLDVRYHRDPWSMAPNGDMLGEAQWAWLEDTLCSSTARVHLIVSGIQVLPSMRPAENWAGFPGSQKRLLELLRKCQVHAPLLLSGDVHFAEISELGCGGSRVVAEVTSSGMTHSWWQGTAWRVTLKYGKYAKPIDLLLRWVMIVYQWLAPKPEQVGSFLGYNFGEVEVNWEAGTLSARIYDEAGKEQLTRTWPFSDLEWHVGSGASATTECGPIRRFPPLVKTVRWTVLLSLLLAPLALGGWVSLAVLRWFLRRCSPGAAPKHKVQ